MSGPTIANESPTPSGYALAGTAGPYAIASGQTLVVLVNGAAPALTVTFDAGNVTLLAATAAQVCAALNAAFAGGAVPASASVVGGAVLIEATAVGDSTSIAVSGTAAAFFGFVSTAGVSVDPDTPVAFDVTDSVAFAVIVILAKFAAGPWECVYDGANWGPGYADLSQVTTITNGYHFRVRRDGGWPSPPALDVVAVDVAGAVAP